MFIREPIALLVNESILYDSKNLVKAQKRKSKFHLKNHENSDSKPKKHEQLLENELFVHWASFDCKSNFSLTKTRYEE